MLNFTNKSKTQKIETPKGSKTKIRLKPYYKNNINFNAILYYIYIYTIL